MKYIKKLWFNYLRNSGIRFFDEKAKALILKEGMKCWGVYKEPKPMWGTDEHGNPTIVRASYVLAPHLEASEPEQFHRGPICLYTDDGDFFTFEGELIYNPERFDLELKDDTKYEVFWKSRKKQMFNLFKKTIITAVAIYLGYLAIVKGGF